MNQVLLENDIGFILSESSVSREDGKTIIRSPTIVTDTRNKNNRIYTGRVVDKHVNAHKRDVLANNHSVGELGHPSSDKTAIIDPKNVSHKFLTLEKEGNAWIGTAELIAGHPAGDMAIAMANAGVTLGVSSRCIGSVDSTGTVIEQGFRLITPGDIVFNPSAPGAFAQILHESTDLTEKYLIEEERIDFLNSLIRKNRVNEAMNLFLIALLTR